MSSTKYLNEIGSRGFCGNLTLLLIAFQLLGVIDLAWYWIIFPLCLPIVADLASTVVLAICKRIITLISFLILTIVKKTRKRRR